MKLSERIKSYFELSKSADEGLSLTHHKNNNRTVSAIHAGRADRAHDFLKSNFIEDIVKLEDKLDKIKYTHDADIHAIIFALNEVGATDFENLPPSNLNYLQCIRKIGLKNK